MSGYCSTLCPTKKNVVAYLMLFQHIQQARRVPRVRTIVKRQRDIRDRRRVAVE